MLRPALPSCPGHEIWQRDMKHSSGVFSIVLEPAEETALEAALSALKIFAIGASWAGTRRLIRRPARGCRLSRFHGRT